MSPPKAKSNPGDNWNKAYIRTQAMPLSHLTCPGARPQLANADAILCYDLASDTLRELFYCENDIEAECDWVAYSYNANYESPWLLELAVESLKRQPGAPDHSAN